MLCGSQDRVKIESNSAIIRYIGAQWGSIALYDDSPLYDAIRRMLLGGDIHARFKSILDEPRPIGARPAIAPQIDLTMSAKAHAFFFQSCTLSFAAQWISSRANLPLCVDDTMPGHIATRREPRHGITDHARGAIPNNRRNLSIRAHRTAWDLRNHQADTMVDGLIEGVRRRRGCHFGTAWRVWKMLLPVPVLTTVRAEEWGLHTSARTCPGGACLSLFQDEHAVLGL